MSSPSRPSLSPENSDRLNQALLLTQELQVPTSDPDSKLSELKGLLARCGEGIRKQNPGHRKHRLEAINKARNFLHFLPDMQHPEATPRLRSVARRLQRAMRVA